MSLPPKDLLVPGPWKVKGNTVLDAYGKTVCVVFARNATAHSYWIAEIPAFAANVGPEGLVGEPESTSDTVSILKARVEKLESRVKELEEELSDANSEITELEWESNQLEVKLLRFEAETKK